MKTRTRIKASAKTAHQDVAFWRISLLLAVVLATLIALFLGPPKFGQAAPGNERWQAPLAVVGLLDGSGLPASSLLDAFTCHMTKESPLVLL